MIEVEMRTQDEMKKFAAETVQAAAPALKAAAEAMVPVARILSDQFKHMTEQARRLIDTFGVVLPPRRRAARKPCAWCTDRFKRPATHIVKWTRGLEWELSPEEGGGTWRVARGKSQVMCEFHAGRAARYDGVRTYRFRRVM